MRTAFVAVAIAAVCAGAVRADVSTQEKTQVKFAGALGRVMNLFGGRATRDGVVTSVAVRGDRKATRTDQALQIVDLNEEKVYDVNLKDKSYTVTTFADIRRQLEEARRKAAEQSAKAGNQPPASTGDADKVEIEFNIKDSGQRKTVNGFDAHEVVMTVAVHEKGKKLEDAGGLVMTANTWLAPKIAGMKELADFDRRYAEKIAAPTLIDAQQMVTAMAMYPMMAEAMKKMQAENVKLDGTAVMTVMSLDAVGDPQEHATAKEQPAAKDDSVPRSLGGLAGRLGRRIAKKDDAPPAAAPADPNRATFLTIQHDVLSVGASVADADLQIPAGFKQK
jgi:hypothetical protein